jgi:CTP-dependent riboflavin kinase
VVVRTLLSIHVLQNRSTNKQLPQKVKVKQTSWITSQAALNERKVLPAQEGLMAFHTKKHNHSFRSVDCTSSILRNLFSKKITCTRTKYESVVVKLFAPFALREVLNDLREAKYVSVMVDWSNHSNLKVVPVLVRYFAPTRGIQVNVIEF